MIKKRVLVDKQQGSIRLYASENPCAKCPSGCTSAATPPAGLQNYRLCLAIGPFERGGALSIWAAFTSSCDSSLVYGQLFGAVSDYLGDVFRAFHDGQHPNCRVGCEYGNGLGRVFSPQEKPFTHTGLERSNSHTHYFH